MKNFFFALCLLVAFLCVNAEEIKINGDFSELTKKGAVANWAFQGKNLPDGCVVTVQKDEQGKNLFCIKADYAAGPATIRYQSRYIPAAAGEEYVLTAKVKGQGKFALAGYRFADKKFISGKPGNISSKPFAVTPEFAEYKLPFKLQAPAGNTITRFRAVFHVYKGSDLTIQEIRLEKVTPEAK